MKRLTAASLAMLFIAIPIAMARWALIPLDELLKKSDLVVIARLANVHHTTKKRIDYGSGNLIVTEVLRGKAKAGDKLRLEWSNDMDIVCPRMDPSEYKGKTMIWLLETATNKTVKADYPGRVIDLKERGKVEELLKKK